MSVHQTPEKRVRAANRLSAVRVAKTKAPGLYEDGAGLRMIVTGTGSKRWALRLTINGRRVERGLGVYPSVTLEEARRRADEIRRAARQGVDARAEARTLREKTAVTFADSFEAFFATRRCQLQNDKHIQQWESTMQTFVYPLIGRRPVAEVAPSEVLSILQPIWFTKPETASRVLQRIRAVFDSAILRGARERANPCIGVTRELGTGHHRVTHHAAIVWRDVPAFVHHLKLRQVHVSTKLLFEFLILTAARSGEARGALWQEIDLSKRLWVIPGNDPASGRRMKSGRNHAVPLSRRALEILVDARSLHDGSTVFPGSRGQPLSDNTLSKLMRDGGIKGTPHGFRSSFKDWSAELGIRDEVSEAALAHTDGNRVRAAYRRTDHLEERLELMERWSKFVTGEDDLQRPS